MPETLTTQRAAPDKYKVGNETIELLNGVDVLTLITDPDFQANWNTLYNECPWGTVFQSPEFVSTWYRIYQYEYQPIIIKAENNGKLTGLLTMACPFVSSSEGVKKYSKRIVGAGHFEACYQTWLSGESNGESFIRSALELLMNCYRGYNILFRYLPPNTPLDWIKKHKKWNKSAILQPYTRPLMTIDEASTSKLIRNSHFRNKLNRLKRLGEVRFERIYDLESFAAIIDEIVAMYDFRQGALYNKNQFRDEPIRKNELLEEFQQNLIHLTVLRVNEKIISAVASRAGKSWVHLGGIIGHYPYNSRFYSPGFLHFTMLGQLLSQEGFSHFDLTPGYETYKEQFANAHDEVNELIIAGNPLFLIKRKMRSKMQNMLVREGYRPLTVEVNLRKQIYLLRNRGLIETLKNKLRSNGNKKEKKYYPIEPARLDTTVVANIQKNNLGNLLDFDQNKRYPLLRWEFLAGSLKRFEEEEHCYTWAEGNRLLCCAWYKEPNNIPATESKNIENEAEDVLLHDIYCHPAEHHRLSSFLKTLASELSNNGKRQVFVRADEPGLFELLHASGLRSK